MPERVTLVCMNFAVDDMVVAVAAVDRDEIAFVSDYVVTVASAD